jgi:hypothetical protein
VPRALAYLSGLTFLILSCNQVRDDVVAGERHKLDAVRRPGTAAAAAITGSTD